MKNRLENLPHLEKPPAPPKIKINRQGLASLAKQTVIRLANLTISYPSRTIHSTL